MKLRRIKNHHWLQRSSWPQLFCVYFLAFRNVPCLPRVSRVSIINGAVVPLHPTVTNPCVILEEIPRSAKWFTVLDFKDAIFCIPLSKESQYIFDFEWEAPGGKHQQMTWTVLSQGFRDSPHLFGWAVSCDLLYLDPDLMGKYYNM